LGAEVVATAKAAHGASVAAATATADSAVAKRRLIVALRCGRFDLMYSE
jgi:hypothetical protein